MRELIPSQQESNYIYVSFNNYVQTPACVCGRQKNDCRGRRFKLHVSYAALINTDVFLLTSPPCGWNSLSLGGRLVR